MSNQPIAPLVVRHRVAAALILALILAGWLVGPAPAAGRPAAHRAIALIRSDPATVRGTGFPARSRLGVALAARHEYVLHVRVSRAGTFTATFPTIVDRCTGWTVTVTQAGAPRLVVRGPRPECAPA